MFTGLIRHIGRVRRIHRRGERAHLVLSHGFDRIPGAGDSIAINGVCLTVISADWQSFSAECFYATLAKSNLKDLRVGDRVHMERALRVGDPLDGHFVQGHVNRTIRVLGWEPREGGAELRLSLPEEGRKGLVREGSVALNGVSLTISRLERTSFSVQLIGETLRIPSWGISSPGIP